MKFTFCSTTAPTSQRLKGNVCILCARDLHAWLLMGNEWIVSIKSFVKHSLFCLLMLLSACTFQLPLLVLTSSHVPYVVLLLEYSKVCPSFLLVSLYLSDMVLLMLCLLLLHLLVWGVFFFSHEEWDEEWVVAGRIWFYLSCKWALCSFVHIFGQWLVCCFVVGMVTRTGTI